MPEFPFLSRGIYPSAHLHHVRLPSGPLRFQATLRRLLRAPVDTMHTPNTVVLYPSPETPLAPPSLLRVPVTWSQCNQVAH